MPDARGPSALDKVLAVLPPSVGRWLRHRSLRLLASPPVGSVSLGDLTRTQPVSRGFGVNRGGAPIDRRYIERFLAANAASVHGRVLEVADDTYARRYGHDLDRVDVLHLHAGPGVTFAVDLCDPGELPWAQYDCVILTQTLQFVRDPGTALTTVHRLLRPGGVLLATFPGISQVSAYDADRWGDRWRFTAQSAREVADPVFGPDGVQVATHGNVLAAVAVLHGLVVEDLSQVLLDEHDPEYPVIVTLRGKRGP